MLRTEFEAPLEQLIATLHQQERMEGELVQVTRDGRRITVACRWALDRDAQGRPGAILTTYNDITERKRAEAALRASEARYRTLAEQFPNGAVFLFDHELRYTVASGTGLTATGLSAAMFVGKTIWEVFPPEIAARDAPVLRAALRGELTQAEVPFGAHTFLVYTRPVIGRARQHCRRHGDDAGHHRAEAGGGGARAAACWQPSRRAAGGGGARGLRDRFSVIASHEVRTPLTSILGYADVLQRKSHAGAVPAAQQTRMLGLIYRQAKRLSLLMGQLFDVTRIDQGQFDLERRPLDLGALVERVTDEFRLSLAADETAPTLELRASAEELIVAGDAERLEQVMLNLLSNAVKYSPSGSPIAVRVAREERQAVLEVADQGIGIPDAAQAHLFESFYRASNVGTISGFGIGLHVVATIVERHGGRIDGGERGRSGQHVHRQPAAPSAGRLTAWRRPRQSSPCPSLPVDAAAWCSVPRAA